jgi:predicted nucleic acid-binding protein
VGTRRPRSVAHQAVVLDSGALIAFERNDKKVRTLIELAYEYGRTLHVPAGVIAEVWRDGRRQARLSRLLASSILVVRPLDREEAQAVGVICGQSRQDDVIDASVILLARRFGARVVTSDLSDLRRLDSTIEFIGC